MTYREDFTLPAELLEQVQEQCARKGCQGRGTSGRIVRLQLNQTTRGSR
jgi:hypothetical protein